MGFHVMSGGGRIILMEAPKRSLEGHLRADGPIPGHISASLQPQTGNEIRVLEMMATQNLSIPEV